MRITRLAASYKNVLQKAKIDPNTAPKLLLQVIKLDEAMNILNWNTVFDVATKDKSKVHAAVVEEIKNSHNKLINLFDDSRVLYEDRVNNTADEHLLNRTNDHLDQVHQWTDILFGEGGEEQEWRTSPDAEELIYIAAVSFSNLSTKVRGNYRPDGQALNLLKNEILGLEQPISKKNLMREYDRKVSAIDAGVEDSKDIEESTGWFEIPGFESPDKMKPIERKEDVRNLDPKFEDFNERLHLMKKIVEGSGWCLTEEWRRRQYLGDGKHLFYIEDGNPRLCIRYEPDSSVYEIQGLNNSALNGYLYADKLLELNDEYPELKMNEFAGALSMRSAKTGKEDVEKYNAMTPEELVPLMGSGANRGNPVFYLLPDTIDKYWDNAEFKKQCKSSFLNGGAFGDKGFPMNINRFPKLKEDKDIYDRAISITKNNLKTIFLEKFGEHGMATVDVAGINKAFKGKISKDDGVAEICQQIAFKLISGEVTDQHTHALIELDSYLSGTIKNNDEVSDLANSLAVNALVEGDLDKFQKLQKVFNINAAGDDLKQRSLPAARREAARLVVEDTEGFERLDAFFDNAFSQDMDSILMEALPAAKEKAIMYINSNDLEDFKALNSKFGDTLQSEPDVYAAGYQAALKSILEDKEKKVLKLVDEALKGEITNNMGTLLDEAYSVLKPQIRETLLTDVPNQDLEDWNSFNEQLDNKPTQDFSNLLEESFNDAITMSLSWLDWGAVKTSYNNDVDAMSPFVYLNAMYDGRLANDQRVHAQAKALARNSIMYRQNPYWEKVLKNLYNIYGDTLITAKDYALIREQYQRAAFLLALKDLDSGYTSHLAQLFNSFPELLENRELYGRGLKKAIRLLAGGYYKFPPDVARMKYEELDQAYHNKLSQSERVQSLLNANEEEGEEVMATKWYELYRFANNLS